MRYVPALSMMLASAALMGQAWDVRVEVPFPRGQELPDATIQGLGPVSEGGLGRGQGVILSLNHRLVRVNPVLRLDWTVDYSQWKSAGDVRIGPSTYGSQLKQSGFGAGLNAQFWIPFTGVAGELGVVQRYQHYAFRVGGETRDEHLSRTWLRVGARWRLTLPAAAPYVAVSYQRPLSSGRPSRTGSAPDLASYLSAQGSGQEFERMWTLGAGVQF